MSKSLLLLTLVNLIWTLGVLNAQKQRANIEFSCMLWEGPLKEQIYYQDGEKYIEIEAFTGSRSLPHSLSINKEFRLFVKEKAENEEEESYRLIGKSALLTGVKQLLFILFVSPEKEKLNLRILVVDDSLKGFPAGAFRFANFTKSKLLVKFSGQTKKLNAREMTIMKSKVEKKGGLIPFIIGNDKGDKIFETRLFAQANGREIVFIMPPKAAGELPSVRFLPQLLPQKLPEKVR